MNGVIDLDGSSDSDEDVPAEPKSRLNEELVVSEIRLKKEETTEEKVIMDDDIGDSDSNLFSADNNDQFPFTLDDKLPDNILEDVNILDAFEKDALEQDNESLAMVNETDETTSMPPVTELTLPDADEDGSETDVTGAQDNDNGDDYQIDGNESEQVDGQIDTCDNEPNDNLSTPKVTDNVESESNLETDDNECGSSTSKEMAKNENENDGKDKDVDNEVAEKRPLSRESTTSTTSSSSERITIRSTSQLNQLVSSNIDIKIKTEKETMDRVEKPGLSVLNPSQLGASDNASGENLLQNASFVAAGDQMMGFASGGIPTQCDVCDTQFPDNVSLDDHRAMAGHYKCLYTPECATYVFPTLAEFSAHQQTVHGNPSPVQQLAHQVQSIPMRYQMDQTGMPSGYQTTSGYGMPNQTNRGIGPQILGSSVQNARYNIAPGTPRIGGVRSVQQPPLPQTLKRGISTFPQPVRQLTPSKRRCVDNYPGRNGDMDCKFVSVQKPDNTDDVVAQLSKSITITARQETLKKNDTAAVANMLANRGITVSSVPTKANKNNPVAMLNLNSAVSLIPTNAANSVPNRQNSGFAVPQSRVGGNRQSLPGQVSQTVDLTGPDLPRNRPMGNRVASNKFTCRICDRPFFNQEQLNQHMTIHRSGPKKQLPFKCPNCAAQYPSQQALLQHRQICRRDFVSGTSEMIIPIVDLKQPGAMQRLQSMGINHMIPLNALGNQAPNGTFGIPILAFSSDRTANINTANMGISNILPVGPLRRL